MVVHVFVMPIALQPVLRSIFLDKVIDSVPEVVWFQQQQLDYKVANLSLVSLVAAHGLDKETKSMFTGEGNIKSFLSVYFSFYSYQTQNESIQSDDVVFPDHVVEDFNALVELLSAG